MKQYGPSQFIERFAEVAADTDYSRHSALQSTTPHDIEAAAAAMWGEARNRGWDCDDLYRTLHSSDVEQVMLCQTLQFDDESHLVSVEFEEYWDATDKMGFSAALLEEIKRELVRKFEERKKKEGLTVRSTRHGIWVFDMRAAM